MTILDHPKPGTVLKWDFPADRPFLQSLTSKVQNQISATQWKCHFGLHKILLIKLLEPGNSSCDLGRKRNVMAQSIIQFKIIQFFSQQKKQISASSICLLRPQLQAKTNKQTKRHNIWHGLLPAGKQ